MVVNKIFPNKLSQGDEVRIISPARSLSIITSPTRSIATERLNNMGLKVSFSRHCEESDFFYSSSVQSRISDLHEAFSDPNIKAILTTIGGYNSIQLLSEINYELIQKNPKIFCGYSDITTMQNAIFAKTGLVTFSGPHYSTFGCLKGIEYVIDYFQKCLFDSDDIMILPSKQWSDDEWYLNQENREFMSNLGFALIQPGKALGTIIGGNIDSFTILQGTEYIPSFENAILFLEDNYPMTAEILDRYLHSLILQKDFQKVQGMVFGRFQKKSRIEIDILRKIVHSKKELKGIPIIAGVDFGHTLPLMTFPIGGKAEIDASSLKINLKITASVF